MQIHVFYPTVLSVRELKEKTNFRKIDPNGDSSESNQTHDERTIGWAVRITDSSAIVFEKNPGYKAGDVLEMTIKKKED